MGAMAIPPRPEKRYILPFKVVAAAPTRGVGEVEVAGLEETVAPVLIYFLSIYGV